MMSVLPPDISQYTGVNLLAAIVTTAGIQECDGNETTKSSSETEDEKKAIYSHPLFPLLVLLFEKCEQASQSADCPSSDSFDIDIQSFVQRQEKDRKPFFSEDPDLDNLMVKAIQVLRIHLLELEKVNELCKDFCNRYINCLRGKLQSEQLLKVESDFDDSDVGSPPPSGTKNVPIAPNLTSTANNVMLGQTVSPASVSMPQLGPGQIMSGGTIYQMVHTPQGLVAQPIQFQQAASNPVQVHGGTPMSQIGVNTVTPASSAGALSALAGHLSSDDEDGSDKKKSKRGVLPKSATQVMKSWLFQHIVHPYPTEDEKRQIANQTNLTLLQVNNWFINARRRILQPMLEASNPEQVKTKKSKPQTRPLQRFWPESLANLQPQIAPAIMSIASIQSAEEKPGFKDMNSNSEKTDDTETGNQSLSPVPVTDNTALTIDDNS
ncbi:homeobox protein PKNOX2-like isoform X1 [Mytilus trossulus]|uniref:homeobox protein PKNOX2-like isoform X1 n=1 Tax=Mytilus trossulus TaxID=6551 RepID=UPI0030062F2B